MQRVSPAARIQPGTCSLGGRPVTPLTAKIGRIMAGKNNRAGRMQPATGKKTGKIMGRTLAMTGKNTGTITITAAAIGEGDTMADTQRGEC